MDQDTALTTRSFDHWLKKAVEWGQTTTLESQHDVCLHLPKLQAFLQQIYETLQHMNTTAVIQTFPLIGQLLGRLCWNPFVVAHDESQKILLKSLCCLYSTEPQNTVESKANDWIRSLLCHLISLSDLEDTGVHTLIPALSPTPVEYHSRLVKNMVSSLVTELQGSGVNGSNMPVRVSSERLNNLSVFCLPLISTPEAVPLIEAILNCHETGFKESLQVAFLEAVNNSLLQKKILLSESAVTGLWLRHLPSLEKATLHLLEVLLSSETKMMEDIVKASLLPQASACHPAIFLVIENIFRGMLLDTDGHSKVLTIIQLFTRCFLQMLQQDTQQHQLPLKAYFPHVHQSIVMALIKHPTDVPPEVWAQHIKCIAEILKRAVEEENVWSHGGLLENWFLLAHFGDWLDIAAHQLLMSETETSEALLWLLTFYHIPHSETQQRTQVLAESRLVFDHLKVLFNQETLSLAELQAALDSSETNAQQSCLKNLINQLLLSFLIFSSGGRRIANQSFALMNVTGDARDQISAMLTNVECWMNTPGFQDHEARRTVKLLQDLFQGRQAS